MYGMMYAETPQPTKKHSIFNASRTRALPKIADSEASSLWYKCRRANLWWQKNARLIVVTTLKQLVLENDYKHIKVVFSTIIKTKKIL